MGNILLVKNFLTPADLGARAGIPIAGADPSATFSFPPQPLDSSCTQTCPSEIWPTSPVQQIIQLAKGFLRAM